MIKMAIAHTMRIGARSRRRGKVMPKKRLPATVNRARFWASSWAKKINSRILENSPGWMENGPSHSQMRASSYPGGCGHTSGRAKRIRPTRPSR